MEIRTATTADLAQIAQIEAVCFPTAEAATPLSFGQRLQSYPNHFWLLLDGTVMVGFVNGYGYGRAGPPG